LDVERVVLDRAESYLGVMIDDLVLQGVTEPYRMLTARAEFRLRLRADNAETRLSPIAARIGCLGAPRRERLVRRASDREAIAAMLAHEATASKLAAAGAPVGQDGARRSGAEWLRFAGVTIAHVAPEDWRAPDDALLAEMTEDARYAPYVERQTAELAALRRDEAVDLPAALDFASVPGLSLEMIERLEAARPATLGAAGRIRGITPAALSAILLQARKAAA
jgi:tRNA uridine 5-carboxymethylaminomethyl modification enzyme